MSYLLNICHLLSMMPGIKGVMKKNKAVILTSGNLYYQDKKHRYKLHNYTKKYTNNCQN